MSKPRIIGMPKPVEKIPQRPVKRPFGKKRRARK